MSTAETEATPPDIGELEEHDHESVWEGEHVSDWTYVKVALLLALLTALEVLTYFESVIDFGVILMPMLLVLMAIKFYLIAAYFMHLKYDQSALRGFFAIGLVLAVGVYVVTLLAFEFFGDWF